MSKNPYDLDGMLKALTDDHLSDLLEACKKPIQAFSIRSFLSVNPSLIDEKAQSGEFNGKSPIDVAKENKNFLALKFLLQSAVANDKKDIISELLECVNTISEKKLNQDFYKDLISKTEDHEIIKLLVCSAESIGIEIETKTETKTEIETKIKSAVSKYLKPNIIKPFSSGTPIDTFPIDTLDKGRKRLVEKELPSKKTEPRGHKAVSKKTRVGDYEMSN